MQIQPCDPPHEQGLPSGFRRNVLKSLPALRAFAHILTGDTDRADDLTEQGLIMAFNAAQTVSPFVANTVWLFTILHDLHFDGMSVTQTTTLSYQDMELGNYERLRSGRRAYDADKFRRQFWKLADHERELLILNSAAGLSRDDVASICFCTPRDIEARLFQAETSLIYLMALHAPEDTLPLSAVLS